MRYALILLLNLLAGAQAAETAPLADPTRPAGLLAGREGAEGSDGGWRLQSVIMPRGQKPTAIINGQVVALGQKLGEARLVRLSETEAVLQGPKGMERLSLIPDVSKKTEVLKAAAMDNEKRKKP
ncbi:MAG TPA: hypothetical protein VJ576_15195 [Rhodocyclaceae bacterium]|nr:hypothetical protein [Rhodocyclaceae bacterium]